MILRPATPLDAGSIGAILTEFAASTDWFPRLHTAAEDIAHASQMIEAGWVTVADLAGEIAGFIARNGHEVNALYIAASAKGAGVGRALIDHAKADAARLELWTHTANTSARRFYRRQGFFEITQSDGAGTDEELPAVQLVWERKDKV